jgi:hypothetical protein
MRVLDLASSSAAAADAPQQFAVAAATAKLLVGDLAGFDKVLATGLSAPLATHGQEKGISPITCGLLDQPFQGVTGCDNMRPGKELQG